MTHHRLILSILFAAALAGIGCRSETPVPPASPGKGANAASADAASTGASSAADSGTGASSGGAAETLKVALLHPGRETDRGWNQMACDALTKLGQRTGVTVRRAYSPNPSNFKSDIRAFAEQGYALVICHGGEYVKAAREVAPRFFGTRFAATGSTESGDGVATLDFRLWEATYLCGILAARVVPEGPAGVIGGVDSYPVRCTLNAFVNGARSVAPDYGAYTQYVGSWDDVAKAAQTAQSLIGGYKARVLFQNADAAAFGVFQAARDAGVFAFGANSDQNDAAPDTILASAVIDMEAAFEQLVEAVRTGRFEDKPIVHDLKSGGITFVPNPRLRVKWPAGTQELIDAARQRIISGELDVLK